MMLLAILAAALSIGGCTLHVSGAETRLDDLTRRLATVEANMGEIAKWSQGVESRLPDPKEATP